MAPDSASNALSFARLHQLALPTPTPSSAASFSSVLDGGHPPSSPAADAHDAKRLRATPRAKRTNRDLSLASSTFSGPAAAVAAAAAPSPLSLASLPPGMGAAPCHMCQRRPAGPHDAPAWHDCALCGARVCFVCSRTCEGPRCHHAPIRPPTTGSLSYQSVDVGIRAARKVCRRCCLEVGPEGTVWCRVCYDDETEDGGRPDEETRQAESVGRVADWLGGVDDADSGYTGDCES